MKYLLTLALLFVCIGNSIVFGQEAKRNYDIKKNGDSAKTYTGIGKYTSRYDSAAGKKRFFPAAGTLLLVEVLPFTYNHFIKKEEFSNISLRSIGHNLQPKNWEFDDDQFTTNQFAHPYHGNLYFNSFRSNGYNFWESSAAAFSGSLLWEIAGEKQAASPNDLINTTLGGLNLGEMTHRIANKILHPHKTANRKKINEVYAFLINPVNGFSRLTQGKWGNYNNEPEDPSKISAQFDGGIRRISTKENNVLDKGKNKAFGRIHLYYVDSTESLKTPFREFIVRVEFGQDDSAKINNLSVYSSLHGWELEPTNHATHRLILSINYDLYDNQAFYYGGQSVNLNWNTNAGFGNLKFNNIVGVGPVLLAAIPDPYVHIGEFRRYNYTSGVNILWSGTLSYKKFELSGSYKGGVVKTINGTAHSHFNLHTGNLNFGYHFLRKWSVNSEYSYMTLIGKYKDDPDFTKKYIIGRLYLRYDLNL